MSQATSTARPRRPPRRPPAPTPLRVIPTGIGTSGNGAFATLCVTLLTVGLIGLLVLNTALAEGSLTVGKLQQDSTRLGDRAGALTEELARSSSTNALAARATALGMVRAGERGYIDLRTGKVTGTAEPATGQQKVAIVVAPMPTPPAVKGLTSAVDGATAAVVATAKAAAQLAATATPKTVESTAPPSTTETLVPSSTPAGPPATTR